MREPIQLMTTLILTANTPSATREALCRPLTAHLLSVKGSKGPALPALPGCGAGQRWWGDDGHRPRSEGSGWDSTQLTRFPRTHFGAPLLLHQAPAFCSLTRSTGA